MTDFADIESVRPQLEKLCRIPACRINVPEIEIANRWQPYAVQEPATMSRFTDAGAWEFIADCIGAGVPIRYKPPSVLHPDHGYELIAAPLEGGTRIYMKVAIRPGFNRLIGISFHYERHP